MRVESSSLAMQSTHLARSSHEVTERLRSWRGAQRPDFESAGRGGVGVTLSARALEEARAPVRAAPAPLPPMAPPVAEESAFEREAEPRMAVLRQLIEAMTGEPMRLVMREDLPERHPLADGVPGDAPGGPARAGFGVAYDRTETVSESEQTTFQAAGVIRTADGKEIAFAVSLAMSREFSMTTSESIRLGDAVRKDPLVINFAGTAAQLGSGRMAFELEGDGKAEQVATLAAGSGYLVLDANGNGKADDGRELFGPATGQGFEELAAYDQDGNGWIDAGDAVWGKLSVWSPSSGSGLVKLGALGIGALSTNAVVTPFALRDGANAALGEIASTGVWVAESGKAGTVQQVDLFA